MHASNRCACFWEWGPQPQESNPHSTVQQCIVSKNISRVVGNGMETELETVPPVLHLCGGAVIHSKVFMSACFDMIGKRFSYCGSNAIAQMSDAVVCDRPSLPGNGNGENGRVSIFPATLKSSECPKNASRVHTSAASEIVIMPQLPTTYAVLADRRTAAGCPSVCQFKPHLLGSKHQSCTTSRQPLALGHLGPSVCPNHHAHKPPDPPASPAVPPTSTHHQPWLRDHIPA